ncbi:MAG: hypothetical protein A2749_00385 [Parcubacteria group bacterium RIFCSPHIGHO2_01_FULL_45_26]|nr:MAG: hypothetical protein A2749_00385 [Parcubacteria group bacterium RIFCSPHIGHO2_01_FULL_45_26]
MISAKDIKTLRDQSGLSISLCKDALIEAQGNQDKAMDILRAKGAFAVEKKSIRTLGAGTISAYVHNTNNIGAMVELGSETDFVAKNDEFMNLAHNIAMHISATNPIDIEALLSEQFIKEPTLTIRDLVQNAVQKFGERVEILRFSRFSTSE